MLEGHYAATFCMGLEVLRIQLNAGVFPNALNEDVSLRATGLQRIRPLLGLSRVKLRSAPDFIARRLGTLKFAGGRRTVMKPFRSDTRKRAVTVKRHACQRRVCRQPADTA